MNDKVHLLGHEVEKLTLLKGDIVVVSVDEILSSEHAARLTERVQSIIGDEHSVIVLGKGMRLGVLKAAA